MTPPNLRWRQKPGRLEELFPNANQLYRLTRLIPPRRLWKFKQIHSTTLTRKLEIEAPPEYPGADKNPLSPRLLQASEISTVQEWALRRSVRINRVASLRFAPLIFPRLRYVKVRIAKMPMTALCEVMRAAQLKDEELAFLIQVGRIIRQCRLANQNAGLHSYAATAYLARFQTT